MDSVALISDLHGNLPALEAVLHDIKRRNISRIFCLGDLVGKGPHSEKVVDICREVCEVTVQGKHGQSILYASAEIIDCMPQRGGGPLRCLYKFEEPQLLHGNGALPQAPRGLGAIDDQGFVRRQRNQCAL